MGTTLAHASGTILVLCWCVHGTVLSWHHSITSCSASAALERWASCQCSSSAEAVQHRHSASAVRGFVQLRVPGAHFRAKLRTPCAPDLTPLGGDPPIDLHKLRPRELTLGASQGKGYEGYGGAEAGSSDGKGGQPAATVSKAGSVAPSTTAVSKACACAMPKDGSAPMGPVASKAAMASPPPHAKGFGKGLPPEATRGDGGGRTNGQLVLGRPVRRCLSRRRR